MIEIEQIPDLDNIPPKVTKKAVPQSINKNLPKLYFSLMTVGAKNSGKSYSIVKLLKNYEKFCSKNNFVTFYIKLVILFLFFLLF